MEILVIALVISCSAQLGFLVRDWKFRQDDLKKSSDVLSKAISLVDEYKAILVRINELDTTRAETVINLLKRVESAEFKIGLISGAQKK